MRINGQFRRVAGAVLLVAALTAAAFAQTTGPFHGCAPEGDGGDARLNYLKNRDVSPPTYHRRTFATVIDRMPRAADEGKRHRSTWPNAALQSVYAWEARGASLVGYIAGVRLMGAEACNCGSGTYRDYHVWLVEKPKQKHSDAVIVEISPRLLDEHPEWPRLLRVAKKHGTLVRISGWMLWDQEHAPHVGHSRATQWEIHRSTRSRSKMVPGGYRSRKPQTTNDPTPRGSSSAIEALMTVRPFQQKRQCRTNQRHLVPSCGHSLQTMNVTAFGKTDPIRSAP